MLAYVFWHWPRPDVARDRYEAMVVDFHTTLLRSPSSPLVASTICAVAGVPWAQPETACYADWYLVPGFADLDTLSWAAVTETVQSPHDQVASLSAGGTGGLYRLRAGSPDIAGGSEAWFAKPAGRSYQELEGMLSDLPAASEGGLWQRQLTLGPGPEFCLVTAGRPPLPPSLDAVVLSRRVLHPLDIGFDPNSGLAPKQR